MQPSFVLRVWKRWVGFKHMLPSPQIRHINTVTNTPKPSSTLETTSMNMMVSTGFPLRRPRLIHLPRSGGNGTRIQARLQQENILEVKPVTSLMMMCRSTGAEGNGSLTVEERVGDITGKKLSSCKTAPTDTALQVR